MISAGWPESFLPKPESPGPLNILLLQGGWSPERPVSLSSASSAHQALDRLGHHVQTFDPPKDIDAIVNGIRGAFDGRGPDVVFNMLHGPDVEDGALQSILYFLDIPFTFSDRFASHVAMRKDLSLHVAASLGIPFPKGRVLPIQDYARQTDIDFPHVIKPLDEGSTFGIQFVESKAQQEKALASWSFGDRVLVEAYIPGREIQVAALDGKAIGAVEIIFDQPIFDYKAKYEKGVAKHIIGPDVPPLVRQNLLTWTETIHNTLGCRGATRSDFRYNPALPPEKALFFLEINTQPGMTDNSLVPEIAAKRGWSYDDVVAFLIADALNAGKASKGHVNRHANRHISRNTVLGT